jgi:hypothetical protein
MMKKAKDAPTSASEIEKSSASNEMHGLLKIQQHFQLVNSGHTAQQLVKSLVLCSSSCFLQTKMHQRHRCTDVLQRVSLR